MNRMFRVIWSTALGGWVVASELTARRGKSGGDTGRRQALVAGVGASALALCCWSSPAHAQAWKGTTSSGWTTGSNWSTGTVPTSAGTVTINTNSPNPTVLGVSGPATATIGTLYLSGVPAATPNTFTSALTIQNGSTLSSGVANIGYWDAGASVTGSATVTVTGLGSSWSASSLVLGTGATNGLTGTSAPGTLNVANGATVSVAGAINFGQTGGSGTLNIISGGTLTTGNATMWDLGASTVNTANISGAGSKWSVAGTLLVGFKRSGTAGTSTLNVANGGAVAATGDITLGGTNLSTNGAGIVTVTGAGSQLSTSGALNIGLWGKGNILTVSNGAVATANTVAMTAVTSLTASDATLNLSSGGTLATQSLTAGTGTAQANFDGGILRATASNTAFVSGFTGTELNIAAGGLTLDTGSFADTVASPFTGVGALTKVGAGTLLMTGDSSYAGGTTISAGTLQLGNGGTAGSIIGDVVNNGTLVFDRSDVSTFGGAISGSGAVNQIGTGTTVLTGNNNYTGGTTISAGTLQFGNGGTSGSITGNVTDNGALAFDRSDTVTYAGQISGTGAVNAIGTGTTILTANNTYAGGTAMNGGTLQVANDSNLGIASGTLSFNGGTLRNTASFASARAVTLNASGGTFETTGNLTLTGAIGGVGALTKTGIGTLLLTADNTYTGGTTISAGTLQLGNGGTSGSIAGDVTNDGALAFDRSDTVAYNGQISGSGAVNQIGTGTTVLTANNAYTGGTTISAGTLQLGNGGTSGSIVGDVTNNGTLAFDRSDTVVYDGRISGSGAVNQIGTGTTILTGSSTYTGVTTISAGTLQVGNGGTSGSIVGNVANNGTLAVDRSDTVTLPGVISGAGALQQIGTGTTILTANNAYTGNTTVSAGTLAIGDASHSQATSGSGNVSVASGAALGGYGQIAGSVQSDGTLAPANALPVFAAGAAGTLRIGGSLTSNGRLLLAAANGTAGNVLQVAGNYAGNGQLVLNTVFNQGGSASQTDLLIVGGNASGSTAIAINRSGSGAQTVGDGIQVVQVGGTSAAKSFRLAGPVQAGAYQYLLYQGGATDSNSWYLRSQLEQTTSSAGAGGAATSTAPGAAASVAAAVAYRPAVIGYSVTPLLNADYGFAVLGRQQARVGDEASADAAQPAHRNGIWGRIGGQNLDADAGNRFSADEHAFFAQFGKDWALAHDGNGASTHVGATVTFGSTSASFSDNLRGIGGLSTGTGTVETQAQSLGGYWTRYLPDGSYFDGVGQLTHYHNRYGDVFGGGASQNGFGAGVSGEVGKPFALGATGVAVEPQAQLLYQYLHLNGFDDGISQVGSTSTNGLRGRLGFRLFKANLSNDSKTSSVTPWFAADVLHDFLSPGQTTVGSTALNDQLGKTWYELGLGVTGTFGKRSTLFADVRYAHSAGGDYRRTVSGQAGYRFSW